MDMEGTNIIHTNHTYFNFLLKILLPFTSLSYHYIWSSSSFVPFVNSIFHSWREDMNTRSEWREGNICIWISSERWIKEEREGRRNGRESMFEDLHWKFFLSCFFAEKDEQRWRSKRKEIRESMKSSSSLYFLSIQLAPWHHLNVNVM